MPKEKQKLFFTQQLFFIPFIVFCIGLALIMFVPFISHAAINPSTICAPDNSTLGSGTNLVNCINNVYIFAVGFASFVAILMFVLAGYLYIYGSEKSVSKAKEIITSTIVALIILFGTYVLLNTIDPNLTLINGIILRNVNCENNNCVIPTPPPSSGVGQKIGDLFGGAGSTGGVGGGTCSAITDSGSPASVDNLINSCFGPNISTATEASAIANKESGGDETRASTVDVCTVDNNPVSFGLFQINISAHKIGNLNCPAAFNHIYTGSSKDCQVVNQDLYQQCVNAATNAAQNIQTACQISGNGTNWSAWTTNTTCHF